ncbi:MAG: conjugative transposon TraM protein [Daejeonella sp.]|nr:conjugative transposon TraM protein [Daejeonella sp.]
MEKQISIENQRKRKFLLVLPLLVLPFITMAFWALGGGQNRQELHAQASKAGLNTSLPDAKFNPKDKQDKFSVYEISAKHNNDLNKKESQDIGRLILTGDADVALDPNEKNINDKLAEINEVLQQQDEQAQPYRKEKKPLSIKQPVQISADVDRLESLMKSLQSDNGQDPEMEQLNGVLEKILDVQHPERLKEKYAKKPIKPLKAVFAVRKPDTISDNTDSSYLAISTGNTIQAVIHQDQDVVSGSVIKLRLADTINANGIVIPKNEFIYGIADINNERLKIDITTLRTKNSIITVNLAAYDLDGLEGLYIPGAISRDAAKKGVDDAIQDLQIMNMNPSVSAQAASAGIQAAKGLFGKRMKQIRVKVKAGYQLFLKDNHQTEL